MIITSSQTIEVVLGAAVATNQSSVTVDYVEFSSTTTTPALNATTTNSTTVVTALSAPASGYQRKVNNITINNADTASISVTVQFNVSGTKYEVIKSIVVPRGQTLQYTDQNGWGLVGTTGGIAELRSGWVQDFNANGTWYKPGNCRFFLVEVSAGGGGGGGVKVAFLEVFAKAEVAEVAE